MRIYYQFEKNYSAATEYSYILLEQYPDNLFYHETLLEIFKETKQLEKIKKQKEMILEKAN